MRSLFCMFLVAQAIICGDALPHTTYTDWTTFKANGVNLGGWLVQESTIDTAFWDQYSGGATDEWGLCENLGSRCSPILEQRYATYITTADIDVLARSGVGVLRIPTTYAAWIKVPGSQLYSGNQKRYLNTISNYAIVKYGMRIIIDIHSLPGGVNGRPFGEADGRFGWFNNQTALSYSYQVVEAALRYIAASPYPQSITFAPLNEPVDNPDISHFGFPSSLSDSGAAWVLSYLKGVLNRVSSISPSTPVMFQGGFRAVSYWAPLLPASANVVFDVHNYYFAGRPTTSANLPTWICADAAASVSGRGDFPVFVGEWSIQAATNNTLASRKTNLNTGIQAFASAAQGSAYWTAKFSGTAAVDGEGTQADYWNYTGFFNSGFISPPAAVSCS